MESRRISILSQYVGTNYAGWQRQATEPTVQAEIESALSILMKTTVKVTGCSRTDAGVHAFQHVSHFDADTNIPMDKMHLALNRLLPDDIVILDAARVEADFSSRFDPTGKQYSYYIWNNRHRNAFINPYSIQEARELDIAAMRAAAKSFVGEHDFKAFMAQGSSAKTTVRELFDVSVHGEAGGLIRVDVYGNAFLYNMVRIIAGTLLYVGLGKITAEAVPAIISQGNREEAGKTLPAKGLFLNRVYYDNSPFQQWYNVSNPLADFI